ncbi:MAG: ankyrin repeat domain-containing protein [Proteobacteria bacterium]|nr:ankyrin repeat domain-containing protein [Pseudomonadota bacterium]
MKFSVGIPSRIFLIVMGSAFISTALGQQDTRLIEAVEQQDLSAFRTLLDLNADVNASQSDGTRALHWAVHRDNAEMVRLLLNAGADVNAKNRYEVAALSLAANNGSAALVSLLLDAGAHANTTMGEDESALMTAARTGVVEVVQLLIDHGADVNARESWRGQTALMWAAGEGNQEVSELLIANGADLTARSEKGFSALLFAAREGHTELVDSLINLGASVNETLPSRAAEVTESGLSSAEQTGMTPLLLAAGSGHFETAALLLEHGADPNYAPLGWTPLHQVSWVRKAGQAGSNNPAPEGSGKIGSLEFVRLLVVHGADLDAQASTRPPVGVSDLNMVGGTPFLLAARTADVDLMRLLVELGADPHIPNMDDSTALMVAAGLGTGAPGEDPGTESEVLEAVQFVLSLGSDINAVDDRGNTAMHGAAYKHVPSVVQYLHDNGAEISIWSQENEFGHTPLVIAHGIHRGMSIVSSRVTEDAIQKLLDRYPLPD